MNPGKVVVFVVCTESRVDATCVPHDTRREKEKNITNHKVWPAKVRATPLTTAFSLSLSVFGKSLPKHSRRLAEYRTPWYNG